MSKIALSFQCRGNAATNSMDVKANAMARSTLTENKSDGLNPIGETVTNTIAANASQAKYIRSLCIIMDRKKAPLSLLQRKCERVILGLAATIIK